MALYAKVRNSDDVIVERRNLVGFNPTDVDHKFGPAFEFRIIPVNRLADPAFDPATHKLGPDNETVLPDEVQVVRTVVALTQEEIDRSNDIDQAKAIYQTLRDGNATNLQVQRVLARLVREQFGD